MQDPLQQGYRVMYVKEKDGVSFAGVEPHLLQSGTVKKQHSIYEHRYELPTIKFHEIDNN